MNVPNLNYKKIAIICWCMFVGGGIIFAYVIFPPILKFILRSQVILKPGTQMRDMYEVLPFPLIYKVYLFHVENPDEVHLGGKPRLKEVGPFVFEEWREKIDIVEDLETDTLEFTERKTFIFSSELSAPLTGNEELTLMHPLLTGIPLTVNVDRAPMLSLISKAVNLIFHKPQTIFWTGKAMDMMFNGIPVDCTSNDFNSKATCSVFGSGEVQTIQRTDEADIFKFSLLGGANGTAIFRFKTYRGVKNLSDLGRIIEFNGESELEVWDEEECNELRGTESSIFPPFKNKKDGIWAFEAAICRSLLTKYVGKSSYAGLPTSRHIIDLGDMASHGPENCYCPNDVCPLKGTLDLFPCAGSPLIGSMPHFLNADPSLSENIASGMNPDPEKHIIYLDMESISGTPMSGAKRMQINMAIEPLAAMDYMHTLPKMVFPMLWVEEGVNLNKTYVNMLKYQLFLGLKFRATVKWICLIVGAIGGIGSTVIYFKQNKEQSIKVTKIQPTPKDEVDDTTSKGGGKGESESDDENDPRNLKTVISSVQQHPTSRFDKAMTAISIVNEDNGSLDISVSHTLCPISAGVQSNIMGSALQRDTNIADRKTPSKF